MSDQTTNLYGQTYEQILDKALAGSEKKLQLVNPQEDWTWPPASFGYIDPQAYRFVGQMPKWTAVGTYRAGGSDMHQAYLQVLSLWNAMGKGIQDDKIREANADVTRKRNKLEEDQQIANVSYITYQKQQQAEGQTPEDYDTWIAKNWKATFDKDKAEYQEALDVLAKLVGEKNEGLQQAIEAATPPPDPTVPKPGFVKAEVGGGVVEVRANYIFPDPKVWADRVAAEGGESLAIHLSASASSSSLADSWAGGGTGLYKGFFALFVNEGWQSIDLATEDKSVEVTITLKAYKVFEVGPDKAWYNSDILSQLAKEDDWNPPFSTNGGDGKTPVFGEGGVLSLVLTGLVAGYQPSIDITMSDATYSKYKESFDTSGGIRVGPFQIGGSGGSSEKNFRKNSEDKKFHYESTATYPFMMGITVVNPGE